MFSTPGEVAQEQGRLGRIARRHALVVVAANFGGPSGGLDAGGGSPIWSEEGELLARLDGPGSGLVVAREDDAGWRSRTSRP